MTERLVAPLKAFGRGDLASAGGKGANLGELVRTGAPVPDGFVVTTDAYATIVAESGLSDRLTALSDASDGAAVRADFEAVTIPEPLRASIVEAYANLGGGRVAVRSSATAEDLPGAAFAGQQDTYLGIVGTDTVLDAVRRCWGSLWTDRAIAYRAKRGIDPDEVRIAVVVQNMVEADSAGVMFTANPVTGHREQTVVDASSGLGEAVVSGLVTPDHYVLDVHGKVRDWSAGRREVVIRSTATDTESGTETPTSGVTHETGTPSTERLLSDQVLTDLVRLGAMVEKHFGRPQDIEWAYVDSRVWLLQARPMTALPPPPVKLNARQRKTGSILLDYLPVRPYPIDMTTWLPHGPVGMMSKIGAAYGIRDVFTNFLYETDGVVDRLIPPAPRPTLRALATPFRLVRKAHRYDPARWNEDPRFDDFLVRARELAARDLTAMSWRELIGVPRESLDLVGPSTELRRDYLPGVGVAMLRLVVALRWLGRGARFGDLLYGAVTRTTDANRALAALAEVVRENPQLHKAIEDLDLEQAREFDEFRAGLDAYLAEYGHRETASPVLVTPPTLGEDPRSVLGLIKVLAAEPTEPTEHADEALQELLTHPKLRDPKRRAKLERLVAAARAGVAFREDSHFYFTLTLPVLRRSLLEIGRRLCDVDVLVEPEQVFHLRLKELEAIQDVAELPAVERERLRSVVRQRADKRDELEGVSLIDHAAVFPRDRSDADALVSGTPASGGVATGAVRVIREPADFGKLASGEVLVCPYTNPSWTPLFQRAVAVVVDSGGPASHAAIVAREYGIPAVMGTASGTSVLTDGQLVTVDGSGGRVIAAESEAKSA